MDIKQAEEILFEANNYMLFDSFEGVSDFKDGQFEVIFKCARYDEEDYDEFFKTITLSIEQILEIESGNTKNKEMCESL